MDYAALRNELLTDPVALGYVGKTDQAAADLLNSLTTGRTQNRTAVSSNEIIKQIDLAAWPAVGTSNESWLRTVLDSVTLDASDTLMRTNFGTVFPNAGATATTRSRLLALATEAISRATELGLGPPTAGDVNLARSKTGGW